jgi:hypothetical protein
MVAEVKPSTVEMVQASLPIPPLDQKALVTLRLYTQRDFTSDVESGLAYLAIQPARIGRILRSSWGDFSLWGGLTGAGLGLLCASRFFQGAPSSGAKGASDEGVIKKDVVITAGCVAGGALIGGVLGSSATFYLDIVRVTQSSAFRDWKAQATRDKVFSVFEGFLRAHENELEEFLCPLTHTLIHFPVRQRGIAGQERVYEKGDIEAWIAKQEGKVEEKRKSGAYEREAKTTQDPDLLRLKVPERVKALEAEDLRGTSPQRERRIRVSELFYDLDYHPRLFARLRQIYNRKLAAIVAAGFQAFSDDAVNHRKQIVGAELAALSQRWGRGEISQEEYEGRQRELMLLTEIPQAIPEN